MAVCAEVLRQHFDKGSSSSNTNGEAEDEAKKPLDAPGFEAGAFESLESDFQEVPSPAARG